MANNPKRISLGTRNKIHAERLRGKFTELENTGGTDPFRDEFILQIDNYERSITLTKAVAFFR